MNYVCVYGTLIEQIRVDMTFAHMRDITNFERFCESI